MLRSSFKLPVMSLYAVYLRSWFLLINAFSLQQRVPETFQLLRSETGHTAVLLSKHTSHCTALSVHIRS